MPHVKATKWPIWETAASADHAPISPSPALMDSMRVLCVNVCSLQYVYVSVCVWAYWIIFSGSGGEQEVERSGFFFPLPDNSWEWWTWRMYHTVLSDCCWSFLEREGVWTWILRKKAALCYFSGKLNAWIDVLSGVFLFVGTLRITTKLDFVRLGRSSRDCCACLCFCEPDPTMFLTASSKHVIVLKQMQGWNSTGQTRFALLSG